MSAAAAQPETRRFSIGYALAPKKVSFIQPSLLRHAKARGIDLIPIDASKPLIDQGPFDCIIHKLYDDEWKKQLIDFSTKNPNVPIIDRPESIERVHDRVSMLQVVSQLQIPPHNETFCVPKQVVIDDSGSLLDSMKGFMFPVIAKPLVANGSLKSHQMYLVFNHDGLNGLKPPIVLQEFVNHGGVVFKVYVAGEFVLCVKRPSLPDISEEKLGTLGGLLPFNQISNLTTKNSDADSKEIEDAEMPSLSLVRDIANGLRRAMKLHLFNFDMIRDNSSSGGNRFLVIDINYFPGYAKMPGYETALTDFFWDIVHNKEQSEATTSFERKGCKDSTSLDGGACLSRGEDEKKLA